jgi:hypothetical protein
VIKRKNREAGKRRDAEEKQHSSRNQQMQGNHESIEAKKRNSRK